MTAFAALTAINDGQATPVAHTFSPVSIDAAGIAKWVDRVGGISIGFPTVTLSVREPSKSSRAYKVTRNRPPCAGSYFRLDRDWHSASSDQGVRTDQHVGMGPS